ncbi:MAG: hypothetical protein LBU37_04175 [Tannerellaceae bacterium]|jgi:hypothetical protein|nr:hypothetical protein [Tannerellaceae bacterium]
MGQVRYHALPDGQFLAFVNTIYEQCKEHSASWGLDGARLASLYALIADASKAYQANSDRATRNHVTSVGKKRAFADLKGFLSIFINYLEGQETVPDAALALMSLRPRVRPGRRPLPVPTEAPLVSTAYRKDELVVYVARSEHGQPTQGVQLKPYHGFKLHWKFEEEVEWRLELSTRLRLTLYFNMKDEGRRIVLTAAWMNPRLQEGPWSDPITKVIG